MIKNTEYQYNIKMIENQELTVCQKHKKKEKKLTNLPANYFLCMNRYCPNAFTVLCQACKPEHRDHTIKILSIQDVCFLVQRLLKTPFKQLSKLITETIEMMQKFKLIREFKKKIDKLQSEVQKEVISLLETTESMVSQYANCKKAAHETAQHLFQIDKPDVFRKFKSVSKDCLSKLDYNFKKDRFQYGSLQIKELEDQRRKTMSVAKHKIEEVKDYSMKIIEVILNTEDSDEEEMQLIVQKKMYENLKEELFSFDLKIEQKEQYVEGLTKSTLETPKPVQKHESASQTNNEWIIASERKIKEMSLRMERMKDFSDRGQTELKNKIKLLERDKQKLMKERQAHKQSFEDKKKDLLIYEKELREKKAERLKKYQQKNELISKMISIWEISQKK